ncbi:endonuclease/exonuclease/phosphatase family protein [Gracilibacillus alcaliphilus]|uniref:endonuclease/exonuclease/phosphatase family protein n=1 Tax=Gracilibacillus alcaliphilus TaxID=1401441 RepID=UPI0019593803|nr:endonuclease/exonuclease/phosphatase family protein [Gracilibacillus alcaliphilus]MBM7676783.1 endonuclease/exonuclease/phosphatase family metal-dependent hydrolase [Gracilibacillus alcaliphilus]
MKKIMAGLAVGALLFSMAGSVFAKNNQEKMVDVNFMSYNIHHGVGLDENLDLERIADVIKDADIDVIGIQEVDRFYGERSDFQDQAKELADMLNYHYVYGANLDLPPEEGQDQNRQYGIGILSKYPIIDSEHQKLDSFGNEQRGLLYAKINIKGVHVNFYNTHLGLSAEERMSQVQEIAAFKETKNNPSVLVGDLNAEPDSEEFQQLLANGNFVDTFADISDSNTFPVINPTARIDYILTSPDVAASNQEVIYSEASDHLPIKSTLSFKKH